MNTPHRSACRGGSWRLLLARGVGDRGRRLLHGPAVVDPVSRMRASPITVPPFASYCARKASAARSAQSVSAAMTAARVRPSESMRSAACMPSASGSRPNSTLPDGGVVPLSEWLRASKRTGSDWRNSAPDRPRCSGPTTMPASSSTALRRRPRHPGRAPAVDDTHLRALAGVVAEVGGEKPSRIDCATPATGPPTAAAGRRGRPRDSLRAAARQQGADRTLRLRQAGGSEPP